jgi:hypothetical protein
MPDLGVIPGEKLNTDKKDWRDQDGFFRPLRCMSPLGEPVRQELLVGPIGCDENGSSGFVVSFGALW